MRLRVRAGWALGIVLALQTSARAEPAARVVPPTCAETTLAHLNAEVDRAELRNTARRDRALIEGVDEGGLAPHLSVFADCLLRQRDPGFDQARKAGYPELEARIARVFKGRSDARLLLSSGLAYLAEMSGSIASDVDVWGEIPFVNALLRRSAEIAPDLDGARALITLGAIECMRPPLVGGQPRAGMSQLERAAELTARTNLWVQLTMAEFCAVTLNDRELFERLLRELLEAPPATRFARTNAWAKQRASHLLEHAHVLFP
mgnify:CR=1 FL=1